MSYLCVAVVGLLAAGFALATPSLENVKALQEAGCGPTQALLILNLQSQPQVKEVKEWLDYFHSEMGGKIGPSLACDDALEVFNGTYFRGEQVDLPKLKDWVAYIRKTSGKETWHNHIITTYAAANRIARPVLSKPHPRLEDVKPLGDAGCSFGLAYDILKMTPRPLLEEINMWLQYFSSDIGGHFTGTQACSKAYDVLSGSNFDGAHKDLAAFKEWVEYFYSDMGGDSKTYESANGKAVAVLSRPHPRLAVLEAWVTYLASQDGGNHYKYQSANEHAFKMLDKPHPCLEDLKLWAKFFHSSQGGGLLPADALTKAEWTLRKKHPALVFLRKARLFVFLPKAREDLKKTAEYFFADTPDGHSKSLDNAWEVSLKNDPVLSDAKFCDGEGYPEAEGGSAKKKLIGSLDCSKDIGCGWTLKEFLRTFAVTCCSGIASVFSGTSTATTEAGNNVVV